MKGFSVPPFAAVNTSQLLQDAMKVAEINQRLIANNIANIDTPKFNPTSLDFQATLRAKLEGRGLISLRKTRAEHFELERFRPRLERVAILSKNDYNKVDLDDQMVKLSENTGRYTIYGSLLTKRFQMIKSMLNGLR